MKISYRWLQEYLSVDLPANKISEILTDAGLEVSSIHQYQNFKGGLEGFVIAEVQEVAKHPNADKLKCTKINIGNTVLDVVCGAPNVAVGQKVVLATIGTNIYTSENEYFTIQKSKIRGEVSEGMLCSEKEIGLSNASDGILVLPAQVVAGTRLKDYLNVYEDTIFEVELTPNRGDAASHIGVARDIYAALYNEDTLKLKKPDISAFAYDLQESSIKINVENKDFCPRYAGLSFQDVQVKESPEWLKNRLLAVGLRPINNVVDVTNFVMYETGQPLHAFDASKIQGNEVFVKTYPEGTKFTTLDRVERSLKATDLMIGNAEKPMCIAGVFGGQDAGVTEQTTTLFIESACFNGSTLRKTSKHHNLFTDASFRYERDTDIEMVEYALKRAALLLKECAGAKINGPIQDIYLTPQVKKEIIVRWDELEKILGITLKQTLVEKILTRLGFDIQSITDGLKCTVPTNKTDVTREIDVIEEVARIYGLNQIPISNHLSASIENKTPSDENHAWKEKMTVLLNGNGYYEAMNNSLTASVWQEKFQSDVSPVHILNPLSSDLNIMRTSMVYGLLQNIAYNLNRSQSGLKFFEFGSVYQKNKTTQQQEVLALCIAEAHDKHWKNKEVVTDYYTIKLACELILNRFNISWSDLRFSEPSKHIMWTNQISLQHQTETVLTMGQLSEEITKTMGIKTTIYYAEFNWSALLKIQKTASVKYVSVNKFPEVTRDLALLVDEHVRYADLEQTAFETVKKYLKSVNIFDVYQGKNLDPGKKSYALRFILENKEDTLKDEQIEQIMSKLSSSFSEKHKATVRA